MVDNVKNIGDFPNLNNVEIGALLGYLIEFNCRIDVVKERFEKVYDKKIGGETIKRILHKNKAHVDNEILKVRSDLQNCAFYHLPFRLRKYEELYYEARKERFRNSAKVGDGEYEDINTPDIPSAISAVKAAAADVHMYEKILIEKDKHRTDDDDSDGELDDGYAEVG